MADNKDKKILVKNKDIENKNSENFDINDTDINLENDEEKNGVGYEIKIGG